MIRLSARVMSCALLLCFAPPVAAQTFRPEAAGPLMAGFGQAVAVTNGMVLVGEAQNTYQPGLVHVYGRSGASWGLVQTVSASDAGLSDGFGTFIDVDGERMVVTATPGGETGAAYVFEWSSGTWREVARLVGSDVRPGDQFGARARIDGDYVVVGAADRDRNTGAVYVFHRDGSGSWAERGRLTASDSRAGDKFGSAFDLDDGRLLVAARGRNGLRGGIYSFLLSDAGAWQQQGIFAPEDLEPGVQFAFTIEVKENLAMLGSLFADNQTGRVVPMLFLDNRGEWVTGPSTAPPGNVPQARFGRDIAIAGNQVLVGAPGSNEFRGSIYVMDFDPDDGWAGTRTVTATASERGDYFGGYLAADGDVAVAGIRGDGGAYVLERDVAGRWAVTARLTSETADGLEMVAGAMVTCEDGEAGMFDCNDVDLVSFLPVRDIGGARGIEVNDLWGWTDPQTGREYAIVGRQDATAFVDVTDALNPVYLGDLPRTEGSPVSIWRDIKVYANHAFIVADGAGRHGMQVFDLTRLRDIDNAPITFSETAHYDGIGSAHNIVINEETGFAYAVGVNSGGETCGGGLHMITIRDPLNPLFAGCFSDPATGNSFTGYTHDAQCVVYHGPDSEYGGHEICFGANETALSIADVTDKDNPVALSNAGYPSVGYAHQGWLTEDQRYFFLDDETDELDHPGEVGRTRTLIFDVADLDDPILIREHFGTQESSDHNLYIRGNLMYQSNYMSGLRILDISDVENPVEVGYFDTVPLGDNSPGENGSWSNYPFFASGIILVTSGQEGLFIVRKRSPLVP